MRHIGKPVPIFRTPALVDGQLTYFGPAQFIGRWIAVYFLPYAGIVKPNFLGHDADCPDQIDTTLLFQFWHQPIAPNMARASNNIAHVSALRSFKPPRLPRWANTDRYGVRRS